MSTEVPSSPDEELPWWLSSLGDDLTWRLRTQSPDRVTQGEHEVGPEAGSHRHREASGGREPPKPTDYFAVVARRSVASETTDDDLTAATHEQSPEPSDSGRARGLGIGRQGATDIVRLRAAGSHRRPTDFYENGSHSCAITRARSHRRLQAGSLETGKRKEKGETGSHPSTALRRSTTAGLG